MNDSPSVLIVEDNPALARVAQFALERSGYHARVAANGRKALQMALERRFDLVITDEQMPEMVGTEMCRHLRMLPEYVDCPIMMLTAKGPELDQEELSTSLRIDAVCDKPFSPARIVADADRLLTSAGEGPAGSGV